MNITNKYKLLSPQFLMPLGVFLIILGIVVFFITQFLTNPKKDVPVVFSNAAMLNYLYQDYKKQYLEQGTYRTIDNQNGNYITTSEGQSYTMLRAVWMDDKDTFDKSWKWTQDNLKRSNDKLFSWQFGKKSDGNYGILTDKGGNNSASDADTDIALSLIFAYSRWGDQKYLDQAKLIIKDIWKIEVIQINGQNILAADNLEKASTTNYIVVNPSYFAPYAYRIFAKVDTTNNWSSLIDSSYSILKTSSEIALNKPTSANIPPDWIGIDKITGQINALSSSTLTTNFGYDAMRVLWRVNLDYMWNNEPKALDLFQRYGFFQTEWGSKNKLLSTYAHNGEALTVEESPALYGGYIGYFMGINSPDKETVYQNKLTYLYSPDKQTFKQQLNYYESNWVWFGIAMYENMLPNLSKDIKF